MGSGESTRKVSFGVDDEDRVRILRGVKLTEDVLQRMRGVANISPSSTTSDSSAKQQKDSGPSTSPDSSPRPAPQSQPGSEPSVQSNDAKPATNAADEQKRYERQQQILKEELAKVARREREVAREEMTGALRRERQLIRQENQNTQQQPTEDLEFLAKQLQKKDAELKALDTFYKEQLALLEKRNMERFKQSSEQFSQAAANSEANVRPRSTEPVCPGLQSQILSCYRDNREQTLRCSDLVKEYMQCINTAKKNLLVNHG